MIPTVGKKAKRMDHEVGQSTLGLPESSDTGVACNSQDEGCEQSEVLD